MRTILKHPGDTVRGGTLTSGTLTSGTRPFVVALAAVLLVMVALGISVTGASAAGPVTGTSCTPSCDIYATTGTLTLPDATTVPIWGYSTSAAAGSATVPGPVLIATAGSATSITLHNVDLPSATSLSISQQAGLPDVTGVTAGNSQTYSFPSGLQPGTYLYEAGLTADGARQIAMGLSGVLIVRPAGAPSQAYGAANTAFTDEAVVVLSEVDPAFNAAPATFDLDNFNPKYWLINGKGYPNTAAITTSAGNTVLVRYANAGLVHHSMSLLGLRQSLIAVDGSPSASVMNVTAQTIPTGSTYDALVTVPPGTAAGSKFPLYEAAMHTDNKGASTGGIIDFGGMLTFISVGGTSAGGGGPVTSNVALSPNPTSGTANVTLSATITPSSGATVNAAEYFVDTLGANGAGCAISGSLTSVSVTIPTSGGTAPCVSLATLSSGNHTFYVHGRDTSGGGTWGAVASAVLNLDKTGPSVSSLSLTPAGTNGTVSVALQGTASDAATGGQKVTAAEYFIDSQPAASTRGTALNVSTPATDVSLSAAIAAATVNGLSEGNHAVNVRGQDALGNWGAFGTVTLKVDKQGPGASGVTATPNPTNGTTGVQVGTGGGFYERIDATVADPTSGGVNSNLVTAEYFIDTVGADGSGGAMFATDGQFTSPSEAVYAAIDLYVINQLAEGTHTVYVHGKDAAGNWGATASTPLRVDRTKPAISGLSTTPNPANLAATITLNVTASDPTSGGINSNITGGEFFWGTTDPGAGSGTAFSFASPAPSGTFATQIDVSQRTIFTNNTLSVRVKDAAGNWSTVSTTAITVDRIFANSFPTSTQPYGWSATGGNAARLSLNAGANMKDTGTNALAASISGGNSGYVVNTLPAGQANYRARFYVNPNGVTMNTNNTPAIFAAMNGNTTVFAVQMRRQSSGQYQVRVSVGNTNSNWYNITGATAIEVAKTSSSVALYTAGTLRQTVTRSTGSVNAARLGLSAGVTNAMNGRTVYFDGFVSSRTTAIGLN